MLGKTIDRLEELGSISESTAGLTRTLLSDSMHDAAKLISSWMQEAGLEVCIDKIGNIIGKTKPVPNENSNRTNRILLCGSHYDTVVNAGKYDGPLGILTALAALEKINKEKFPLKYQIALLAFADEEGGRFHSPYIGSKFTFGQIRSSDKFMECCDTKGKSIKEILRELDALETAKQNDFANDECLGYIEAHIEQGRILEEKKKPAGVVQAIAGQARIEASIEGFADHAGNTPMNLRRDALCAASEFILFAEKTAQNDNEVLITIGHLDVQPNSSNTIPAKVVFSIDLRSANDDKKSHYLKVCQKKLEEICSNRKLKSNWNEVMNEPAVKCDSKLTELLAECVAEHRGDTDKLTSGAGHDGVIVSRVAPISMFFVRCRKGISHHPEEYVNPEDVETAINIFVSLLKKLNAKLD